MKIHIRTRIGSTILAIAMLLTLLPVTALAADPVAQVGSEKYDTLTEAFAALNETNYSLTLLDNTAWDKADIYWQAGTKSGYAATLRAAVVDASDAQSPITLICKPGADIADRSQHINVTQDITIYANGANFGGDDLSIGTYAAPANLKATVNIYGAKNLVVWGGPVNNRADVWNVNFVGCENDGYNLLMYRGNESGKAQIHLTLTECKASGYNDSIVHTSADGSIKITECTFADNCAPVNIAHKQAGEMAVTIENSTFTGCGSTNTANSLNQYAAPIRFVNNGTGTLTAVVDTVTITDTVGKNGDILLGDGRTGKSSTPVSATIRGTTATVQVQYPGDWANDTLNENVKTIEIDSSAVSTCSNVVATIGTQEYTSLEAAINAAQSDDTIQLISDVTLADDTSFAIDQKIQLVGVEVNGKKPTITVHYTGTSGSKGLFTFQTGSAGSSIENLQINITGAGSKRAYAVLFADYKDTTSQIVIRDVDFVGSDSLDSIGTQIGISATNGTTGGNVLVTGCTFTNFCYGIYMDNISNFVFDNNRIDGTKYNAVNVGENGGSNIKITNNRFTNISYANWEDDLYSSGIGVGKSATGVTIESNSISMLNGKLPIYIDQDNSQIAVTFQDGDALVAKYLVTAGDIVILPAAPIKYGYTFLGWKSSANGKVYDADDMVEIDGNTTFTAQWVNNWGVVGGIVGGSVPEETFFTDVSSGAWYYDAVKFVYDYNLMNGVGNNKFNPTGTLTRAMVAQVLYNLDGASGSYPSVFTDVSNSAWYAKAVNWAAASGIVEGKGNNKFDPNAAVTRQEMATILYRYSELKGYDVSKVDSLAGYKDAAKVSTWAKEAMGWAVANYVINGVGNDTLNPTGTATRAQVAQILMNYCNNVL